MKRKLEEIVAELDSVDTVRERFTPLQLQEREPKLRLPDGLDPRDPYALFSLFLPDSLFEAMSRNTNAYAARKLAGGDPFPHARAWHPTSPAEIKVFVGILIYMGVHHITSVEDLWRRDGKVPSHLPSQYMSRVRFEQIQRFLKVSDPREDDERKRSNSKEWWYKVELMANCFQEAAARYIRTGCPTSQSSRGTRSLPWLRGGMCSPSPGQVNSGA